MSESLALASTFGHISEQTNASKYERTRISWTLEQELLNELL